MNFSTTLNEKAQYNSVKYSAITESGLFASLDNVKEVREFLKSRSESAIVVQGRFGIVALTDGQGKATFEGTKKFEALLSTVTFN